MQNEIGFDFSSIFDSNYAVRVVACARCPLGRQCGSFFGQSINWLIDWLIDWFFLDHFITDSLPKVKKISSLFTKSMAKFSLTLTKNDRDVPVTLKKNVLPSFHVNAASK